MLSAKQKQWLWQDKKKTTASDQDIPTAKSGCGPPPSKQARCLASAVNLHSNKIENLTNQNKRLITALSKQGIDISKSNDL